MPTEKIHIGDYDGSRGEKVRLICGFRPEHNAFYWVEPRRHRKATCKRCVKAHKGRDKNGE